MITDTIKAIMKEKHISQSTLAKRMGISPKSLSSKLNRGTLSAHDLIAAMDALDCDISVSPKPGFRILLSNDTT